MGTPASLQEKFQITAPGKDEAGEGWASFESARDSQAAVGTFVPKTSADTDMRRFNEMPPGMGIDQCRAEINNMPLSMAGESDVSKDTSPTAFANGFTRRSMKGTDDQYTGEHMDLFYGEVFSDEGEASFLERNNYLDRI